MFYASQFIGTLRAQSLILMLPMRRNRAGCSFSLGGKLVAYPANTFFFPPFVARKMSPGPENPAMGFFWGVRSRSTLDRGSAKTVFILWVSAAEEESEMDFDQDSRIQLALHARRRGVLKTKSEWVPEVFNPWE